MRSQNTPQAPIEALEERRMLSASVIRVEGTRQADTVAITRMDSGQYDVNVNGHHKHYSARSVRSFNILTGRGNDRVTIGNDNGGVRVRRSINVGGGDDSVLGGKGADDIIGGDGDDSLNGRQGDDSIRGDLGDDSVVGGVGDD